MQTTPTPKTARQVAWDNLISFGGLVETYRGFKLRVKLDTTARTIEVSLSLFGRTLFDEVLPEKALETYLVALLSMILGGHAQSLGYAFDLALELINEWFDANKPVIVPPVADPEKK